MYAVQAKLYVYIYMMYLMFCTQVICNIKLVEGSKHVVLYSSVRVINKTNHPFSLLYEPDGSHPQEGAQIQLPPEGTSSVPVELVAHCWLRVQPAERHTWSAPLSLRDPPRDSSGAPTGKTWLINAGGRVGSDAAGEGDTNTPASSFFVWIRVHSPNGFQLTITFTPILTLHNELAMTMHYRIHYGSSNVENPLELRGVVNPGEKEEHHSFSPEDAAYLFLRLPGFKWSTSFVRIQADKRLNSGAELHEQLLLSDETDDNLTLAVRLPRSPYLLVRIHESNLCPQSFDPKQKQAQATPLFLSCGPILPQARSEMHVLEKLIFA